MILNFYETDEEDDGEGCNEMSTVCEQPYITSNESKMILPSRKSTGNRIQNLLQAIFACYGGA